MSSKNNDMKTTLEGLKQRATIINKAFNNQVGTPYWNTYKRYVKTYFQERKIGEISVNAFSDMSGLSKEYAKTLLLELNAEHFKNS
jgi:hypothetical protein